MLLHVTLGRKSSITDGAFKWSFFSVASIVDFEGRVTSESLVADVAGSISAHCVKYILG